MNIICSELPPGTSRGRYAHFEHRDLGRDGWRRLDIRAAMTQRRQEWRQSLEAWHAELSRRAASLTRYWWLTDGSRLTAWYPFDLKPLFFALALAEEYEKNPGQPLYAVGCPPEVAEYLTELRTGRCPRRLAYSPQPVRAVSPLRLTASLAVRVLSRYLRPEPDAADADVIAFSYVLRGEIFEQQDDHYFGKALDELPGLSKDRAFWSYHLDHLRDGKRAAAALARRGRRHAFYFDFLSLADIVDIRARSFRVLHDLAPLKRDLPPLEIGRFKSRAFSLRFFRDMIIHRAPIEEMSVYIAFARMLRHTRARTVVYPYEEKGIERALLFACGDQDRPIRTVAFAHAVYNEGHFYLDGRAGDCAPPRPDTVAATSDGRVQQIEKRTHRSAGTIPAVGSPRHVAGAAAPPSAEYRRKLRVLALIGHGFELEALANLAENGTEVFRDCELLVRCYPYGWAERQTRAAQRIRTQLPETRIEIGSMEEQIRWCDVALFDSTSAGIHCMLRGRPAIHLALHDFFPVNPFGGHNDSGAPEHCADAGALRGALARFRAMTRKEYLAAAARQMRAAAGIYAPLDRARWALALGAKAAAGRTNE